ncbi:MAG: cysteine--tRNA ligase [Coriobacteriales bacterium]|nr:cysteine--tRNA ligase [Coriobacteriales bacterium]
MKLYDSSRREKVPFIPLEEGRVRMYVCGPTVYDDIHIGNARTFLSFDVIRRWFTEQGYEVTFVQNLTDVDDKIIKRGQERGVEAAQIAATYTEEFINITRQFGILEPTIRPRATQEIGPMIEMIQELIAQGYAYELNGDVYFAVRSDKEYGHVSGKNIDDLMAGARIEADETKRDPLDFALWKSAKPGEPTWDSPWGPGRPGWHTECAAMVHRYLGMPIDIHGGGADLQFPHHENESAQAESCWHTPFANHWMHTGMLRVNGEKMSKSLGNFFTLKEILEKHSPAALRLLMLQTHYRSPLDFSFERLEGAQGALERIANTIANLAWAAEKALQEEPAETSEFAQKTADMCSAFSDCMDDDFNTAGALAEVFELVSASNSYLDSGSALCARDCLMAHDALLWALGVLGIEVPSVQVDELPKELIDLAREMSGYQGESVQEASQLLIDTRAQARKQKDWPLADVIRNAVSALGLLIEDTANGTRIKRA